MRNIIERVAEIHGTTPDEALREMLAALEATGLNVDLETFIEICSRLVVLPE